MQAREFMERVRQAEEELKLIAERRRHYMEMATSTTSRLTPVVVKTGPSSKVENAVVGMTDLLTRLDVREAEYTAIVQQAEQLIERIPQFKFRQVLTLRYLAGLNSWQEISEKMGYTNKNSAANVHGYALKELDKVLTNDGLRC